MLGSLYNRISLIKSSAIIEIVKVPREVNRSWRERLLSRPWRPWIKTKTVEFSEARPAIVKIGDTIYYHPSLEEKLKETLQCL